MKTKEKQIEEGHAAYNLLNNDEAFIQCVADLREEYLDIFENSDFMDNEIREAAYRKLAALQDMIADLSQKVSIFNQIRADQEQTERRSPPEL